MVAIRGDCAPRIKTLVFCQENQTLIFSKLNHWFYYFFGCGGSNGKLFEAMGTHHHHPQTNHWFCGEGSNAIKLMLAPPPPTSLKKQSFSLQQAAIDLFAGTMHVVNTMPVPNAWCTRKEPCALNFDVLFYEVKIRPSGCQLCASYPMSHVQRTVFVVCFEGWGSHNLFVTTLSLSFKWNLDVKDDLCTLVVIEFSWQQGKLLQTLALVSSVQSLLVWFGLGCGKIPLVEPMFDCSQLMLCVWFSGGDDDAKFCHRRLPLKTLMLMSAPKNVARSSPLILGDSLLESGLSSSSSSVLSFVPIGLRNFSIHAHSATCFSLRMRALIWVFVRVCVWGGRVSACVQRQ